MRCAICNTIYDIYQDKRQWTLILCNNHRQAIANIAHNHKLKFYFAAKVLKRAHATQNYDYPSLIKKLMIEINNAKQNQIASQRVAKIRQIVNDTLNTFTVV